MIQRKDIDIYRFFRIFVGWSAELLQIGLKVDKIFAFPIMIVNFVVLIAYKSLFIYRKLWKIVLKTPVPRAI